MKTNAKLEVMAVLAAGIIGLGAAAAAGDGAAGDAPASSVPGGHARWAAAFHRAKMGVVADRLGLTADQRAKLKDIRTRTASSVQAIRANSALTAEQKQAQVAAARQGAKAQMKAVLTDEQLGKLAFIRSHPRQLNELTTRRVKMGMAANRLGLSPDQRAKIRDITQKTAAAVKPVRQDPSLTPAAKREKVRQLVDASRTEIRGVLTAEQQVRLEHMRRRLLAPLGPLG